MENSLALTIDLCVCLFMYPCLKSRLRRLKPQAEKMIAEEQVGFRAGRSITQQNDIQPKNPFVKISSAAARPLPFLHRLQEGLRQGLHTALWALWATMKKYNISANLIQVTIYLCGKVTSAALFNRSIGDWVGTTVAVRQGCLYSHPPSLTI